MIIDDIVIYHIGASLKDLGKKWFAFRKMDEGEFWGFVEVEVMELGLEYRGLFEGDEDILSK